MHEPMKRKRQQLSQEETAAMLREATSGVLALTGADGHPYAVPMSFAYDGDRLLFHSARVGHKLDAIAHDDRASFCVIADDDVIQETFTTHYRSAIVFGRIRTLAAEDEKRRVLMLLAEKYSPDHLDRAAAEIEQAWDRMVALELAIEEMTGKAGIEVINQRAETGPVRSSARHPKRPASGSLAVARVGGLPCGG
jgi:nitroimidazol reductase NimA-like FMN-containing flavoprotein (pyridoxamine 5'-phosphate oxidase superfamily)